LLYFVLEIEKGPIHPLSWSIDPYKGEAWGGAEAATHPVRGAGFVMLPERWTKNAKM